MGINKVKVYTMTCDKCGKGLYPKDDMIYHEDIDSLEFVAEESQWNQQLDGRWFVLIVGIIYLRIKTMAR